MPVAKLNVPIIYISSLFSQEEANSVAKKATVTEIGNACRDWGFLYVTGHNVDSSIIQQCKDECFEFFGKSKEFKKTVSRKLGTMRGYCDEELTKKIIDCKECFSYGAGAARSGVYVNLWPEGMPNFKSALMEYFQSVYSLSQELLLAMFAYLNVNQAALEIGCYESSACRLNLYPKCHDPNKHLGCGPHTDASCLTILLQDDGCSSLQVERDGQFYDIPPVKDSFVVNIGETTQYLVWSNDIYKAPKHQVLTNKDSERLSVAFFLSVFNDTIIKPMKECTSDENPPIYRAFTRKEFFMSRVAAWDNPDSEGLTINYYKIKY